MVWTEVLCSLELLCILVVGIRLHAWFAKDGSMNFDALHWQHITHSPFKWCTEKYLASFRLVVGLVMPAATVRSLLRHTSHYCVFFTHISFIVQWVYFLSMGIITVRSIMKEDAFKGMVGFGGKVLWVLFEVCLLSSVFVFLVVWCVLIPIAEDANSYFWWDSLVQHNFPVFALGVEASLNRMTVQYEHVVISMYALTCYLTMLIIYSVFQDGWFPYFFVDWTQLVGVYGFILILCVVVGIHTLAARLTQEKIEQDKFELVASEKSSLIGTAC